MPPKRSLRRPPAPPVGHGADTYVVGNRIYETATRRLVASWREGAHRFTERGRELFQGRTVFVLEVPSLQYAGRRNWVDDRSFMYYPVSKETMPGLEAAWQWLTQGPGKGSDRIITQALKDWVIERLSLGKWAERTQEDELIEQEVIGFGSGDL